MRRVIDIETKGRRKPSRNKREEEDHQEGAIA
jgi:hypothetical protein